MSNNTPMQQSRARRNAEIREKYSSMKESNPGMRDTTIYQLLSNEYNVCSVTISNVIKRTHDGKLGGPRPGSGRHKKYNDPLNRTIAFRVTEANYNEYVYLRSQGVKVSKALSDFLTILAKANA